MENYDAMHGLATSEFFSFSWSGVRSDRICQVFDDETIHGVTGKRMGQIDLFLLDVKMYAHLSVSINRLFSLLRPFQYHAMDANIRVTFVNIASAIVIAFIQVFPLFWGERLKQFPMEISHATDEGCYFVYFTDIAIWGFGDTSCSQLYFFYQDFLLSVCIFCFILFLDAIAVITLRQALDLSQFNQCLRQKRLLEIGFFVQSLCRMVPSLFVYFSFTFISRFATTDWELFGTTTLVWVFMHALDGVIMDIFQARKVFERIRAKSITVSTTNGSAPMSSVWISNVMSAV